jgi:hypothetical protein
MTIERESVHFQILQRLCRVPAAVRGTSGAMLERDYGAPSVITELARAGLIRERGWHSGPGAIWIPTEEGIALYQRLVADAPGDPPRAQSPRWVRRDEA